MIRQLLLAAFIVCAVLVGGCAGTCDTIVMERHPHDVKPPPAKQLVLKCGRATTTMNVDAVPECLDRCFEGE